MNMIVIRMSWYTNNPHETTAKHLQMVCHSYDTYECERRMLKQAYRENIIIKPRMVQRSKYEG